MTKKKLQIADKKNLIQNKPAAFANMQGISGLAAGNATLNLLDHVAASIHVASGASVEKRKHVHLAAVETIIAMQPKDAIEGHLIAQMVVTHEAVMDCYRRFAHPSQNQEARESVLNLANKLLRTYAMLVDTLNKHRGKGQQTVRVEHVTVEAGGQAIVGNVTTGGGGGQRFGDQPHVPSLGDANVSTMWSSDSERTSVPGTGGAGEEALPEARRRQG